MLMSDHKATEHSLLLEGMHLFWHQIYIFKGQIPWSYKYVQKILAAYLQEQFQVKRAASMYFWSVSWSTNCSVYFSFFLVDQKKIWSVSETDQFFFNIFLVSL